MTIAPALLPYTVRGTRWSPVAAAAGAGLAFVLIMTLVPVTHGAAGLTNVLRVAALFGAVGAGFLLDDPSESSTAVTPAPRLLRILLRPLAAMPAVVLWWSGVLLMVRLDTDTQTWRSVPVTGCTLELAALVAIAAAMAAVVGRRPPHHGGGTAAAPTIVGFVVAAHVVPHRYRLFVEPGSDHWATVHGWWAALLAAAVLLLVWAGRDLTGVRR